MQPLPGAKGPDASLHAIPRTLPIRRLSWKWLRLERMPLQQNLDLVQRGDNAEFIARFRKIAEWFGPFSEQAMRESTFLVDKLVHRF